MPTIYIKGDELAQHKPGFFASCGDALTSPFHNQRMYFSLLFILSYLMFAFFSVLATLMVIFKHKEGTSFFLSASYFLSIYLAYFLFILLFQFFFTVFKNYLAALAAKYAKHRVSFSMFLREVVLNLVVFLKVLVLQLFTTIFALVGLAIGLLATLVIVIIGYLGTAVLLAISSKLLVDFILLCLFFLFLLFMYGVFWSIECAIDLICDVIAVSFTFALVYEQRLLEGIKTGLKMLINKGFHIFVVLFFIDMLVAILLLLIGGVEVVVNLLLKVSFIYVKARNMFNLAVVLSNPYAFDIVSLFVSLFFGIFIVFIGSYFLLVKYNFVCFYVLPYVHRQKKTETVK